MRLLPWLLPLSTAAIFLWALAASALPESRTSVEVARGAAITASPSTTAISVLLAGESADEGGAASHVTVPAAGEVVDLARFAFDTYDPPELRGDEQEPLPLSAFPEAVRVLDQRVLDVSGYSLATDFDQDGVSALMLSRFPPGCCFGARPVLDEWLQVELQEPAAPSALGGRTTIRGKVEVGEELDQTGFVRSLYRIRDGRLVP